MPLSSSCNTGWCTGAVLKQGGLGSQTWEANGYITCHLPVPQAGRQSKGYISHAILGLKSGDGL